MDSATDNPTPSPQVKPTVLVVKGKPRTRFYQFEVPKTANRHGQNLTLDVEYLFHKGEEPTRDEPGLPASIQIETLTLNGHDLSVADMLRAGLEDEISDKILSEVQE